MYGEKKQSMEQKETNSNLLVPDVLKIAFSLQ